MGALRPLTPVGEPLQWSYFPVCGSPRDPGSVGLDCVPSLPLLPLLTVAPSRVLRWRSLLLGASLFMSGGAADSCDFWGVHERGGAEALSHRLAGISYQLFFSNTTFFR